MKLFLGIDGGQSSTTALIGDETGRVLGIGRAGPCNHARSGEGREKFLRAMRESIAATGIADPHFACACLGLSGGPADKDSLAREVIRAEKFVITHDAAIALSGALAGEPGIVTIAGTGSMAFGKDSAGRSARAGGWGYIFGDEGSAFGIVRNALRAVLRHREGWGPETRLTDALLESTASRDADELLHRFYSDEFPRSRTAALAERVDHVALAGDHLAREILNDAAQSLAMIASAVRSQLFDGPAKLSYHGGVFRSAIVLERFKTLAELADCEVIAPKSDPAHGALLEAYRSCSS